MSSMVTKRLRSRDMSKAQVKLKDSTNLFYSQVDVSDEELRLSKSQISLAYPCVCVCFFFTSPVNSYGKARTVS